MIPSSASTLVAFLLFLAPGALWHLRRERFVPTVKQTALLEGARIVLASVCSTCASALILAWWWWPVYVRLADRGPKDGKYLLADLMPFYLAAIATALLACGLVFSLSLLVWRGKPKIDPGRVWNQLFSALVIEQPMRKHVKIHLTVRMNDGTIWAGGYFGHDVDPEDNHRCLALKGALWTVTPEGHSASREGIVVLAEANIASIRVQYILPTPTQTI